MAFIESVNFPAKSEAQQGLSSMSTDDHKPESTATAQKPLPEAIIQALPEAIKQTKPEATKQDLPEAAKRALQEAAERRRHQSSETSPKEINGREGPDPVRFGDWEKKGLAIDF
jgi:hypothetical protein